MDNRCIDWQELLFAYNQFYNTKHLSVKTLLEKMYDHHKNLHKMGMVLGVSPNTIRVKMDSLKIKRKKLHRTHEQKKSLLCAIPESERLQSTATELAERLGVHTTEIYKICKELKLGYKRRD